MSFIVSVMSVPAFLILTSAPHYAQFPPVEGEQPWCDIPPGSSHDLSEYASLYRAVALAGMAFSTHILSDTFTSIVHGTASTQQMVHHVAFFGAGFIIRGHCLLPFSAAALMSMEISTPFLNFLMIFRNRGPRYARAVQIATYFFVGLFIVFRLLLNTYGVVLLWLHPHSNTPPSLVAWEDYFVLTAITVGALLQFVFFWQVIKALVQRPVADTPASNQQKLDAEQAEELHTLIEGNISYQTKSSIESGYASSEREDVPRLPSRQLSELSDCILPDGRSGNL